MRLITIILVFIPAISYLFADESGETNIIFPDVLVDQTGHGQIKLTVDSKEEISGLQFTLYFDPQKIKLGTPQLTKDNQQFSIVSYADDDSLKVLMFSREGEFLDREEPILTIPLSSVNKFRGSINLQVKQVIASSPHGKKMNIRISSGKIYILPELPLEFHLDQNFPNPFNAETVIRFDLPEDGNVLLMIRNVLGQTVQVLTDSYHNAGFHSVVWEGDDKEGNFVPSGEYICSIYSEGKTISMKMVLLR
ncbi:MAG: T9SS type A sorting domain-containing protein [Candidatus Marinimicrobia bacterium]|nr:T9SS type A sorting domain-containing protein [Candidatus Neomarinimicrobiota bacterium]